MGDTFQNLYEDTINDLGLDTNESSVVTMVKRFLNNRYEEYANWYPWRWLYELDYPIQTIAVYNTGTITVVNGSTTVLGDGTTFTSAMTGRKIRIIGFEESYKITYVSSTELTLDAAYNGTSSSSATYGIYQDEHTLPADCQEIIAITQSMTPYKLRKITLREKKELVPNGYLQEGINLSRDPLVWTPLEIESDGDCRISLYPEPYRQILLRLDYKKEITRLSDNDDEPLIPSEKRFILKLGAKADLYREKLDDSKKAAMYEGKFYAQLKKAIAFAGRGDDTIKIIPNIDKRKILTNRYLPRDIYLGDIVKTL